MNKLRSKTAYKIALSLVVAFSLLLGVACVVGVVVAGEAGFFSDLTFKPTRFEKVESVNRYLKYYGEETLGSSIEFKRLEDDADANDNKVDEFTVSGGDVFGVYLDEDFMETCSRENCNVSMTITNSDGKQLACNYSLPQNYVQNAADKVAVNSSMNAVYYDGDIRKSIDYGISAVVIDEQIYDYYTADELSEYCGQPVSGSHLEGSMLEELMEAKYRVSNSDARLNDFGYDEEKGMYYVVVSELKGFAPDYIVNIESILSNELTAQDQFSQYRFLYDLLADKGVLMIVLGCLSAVFFIVGIILLILSIGWRENFDKPQRKAVDKIPLMAYVLIHIGACAAVAAAFHFIIADVFRIGVNTWNGDAMAILFTLFGMVSGVMLLVSFIRRLKTGTLWKTTLLYHIYRLVRKIIISLPTIWKILLGGGLYCMFSGVCLLVREEGAAVLWCLVSLGIIAALCVLFSQFKRVVKTTERIASGAVEEKIDTEKLTPELKKHAQQINRIGDSVTLAVDDKMRSERMKTDLITNVSHDIKTPLTSIISYVDLLKSIDIQNETAEEYIEVLERQSERLKRLVNDLVEASKASSGSINAMLMPVSLIELLNQSVAEYDDRLAASGVTPVLTVERELTVMADGRLLWRVFDNLLSNVCKYSIHSSRLYIDGVRMGDTAVITFRNISAAPLNITPEELMERFVRGDISRSTEGSGLGLSIAKSLVELQNGSFKLSINGDLFCAEVRLAAVEPIDKDVVWREPEAEACEKLELPALDAPEDEGEE